MHITVNNTLEPCYTVKFNGDDINAQYERAKLALESANFSVYNERTQTIDFDALLTHEGVPSGLLGFCQTKLINCSSENHKKAKIAYGGYCCGSILETFDGTPSCVKVKDEFVVTGNRIIVVTLYQRTTLQRMGQLDYEKVFSLGDDKKVGDFSEEIEIYTRVMNAVKELNNSLYMAKLGFVSFTFSLNEETGKVGVSLFKKAKLDYELGRDE